MGTKTLDSKSIGTAELQTGQSLATQKGKAEILLTPGVFLRVGNNSSVRMISPSLTDTEVAVDKGHAMIEVAEIHPENNILISEDGTTAKLLKTGLYDFDLRRNQFRVFDGKASVERWRQGCRSEGWTGVGLAAGSPLKSASSTRSRMKRAICIVGAACDRPIWRRPTWMRRACIPGTIGVHGAGPIGTGTHGSMPTLSFQEMAYGIARSAGASIRPGASMTLRSSAIWGMVTATPAGATSITSAITVIGNHIRPTSQARVILMASTMVRDRRGVDFILDLE